MNTAYKSRLSPYQLKPQHPIELMREKAKDVQDGEHPARKEIQRVVGTYQMTAEVVEDKETLATLSRPGVIAFLCTIKREGQIIGIGRGSAVLNQMNKFISRTVHAAFNYSLLSAVAQSTRALDALIDPRGDMSLESADAVQEPITDKQKSYLTELVQKKVRDESTIGWYMENIGTMTKDRASTAIQELSGK
ncbi:MAG: hypothetical protein Q7S76_00365 [bacterium]|nr:hypothetical protein [bacterium]